MVRRVASLMLCSLLLLPSCNKKSPVSNKGEPATRDSGTVSLRPALPFFMDGSAIGSALNAKGEVEKDDTMVQAGAPVYLTLHLHESPPGLQVGAVWSHDGKVLTHEVKQANGGKVFTFVLSSAKLAPGKYRVVGYWGANVAADKKFEIVSKAKT
jgi:hypothetical protein